jgi:hypothetical protein
VRFPEIPRLLVRPTKHRTLPRIPQAEVAERRDLLRIPAGGQPTRFCPRLRRCEREIESIRVGAWDTAKARWCSEDRTALDRCSAQRALGQFRHTGRCAHPKVRFSAREISSGLLQHPQVPRRRCVGVGQRHRLDSYNSRVKRASPRRPSYAYSHISSIVKSARLFGRRLVVEIGGGGRGRKVSANADATCPLPPRRPFSFTSDHSFAGFARSHIAFSAS